MSETQETDFAGFLATVKNHRDPVDDAIIADWRQRFNTLWSNDSDHWCSLVELLPLPEQSSASFSNLRNLILKNIPESLLGRIAFLAVIGHDHLADRYWSDQTNSRAIEFVAGCINLIRAVADPRGGMPAIPTNFPKRLQETLLSYPRILAAISATHATDVHLDAAAFKIGSAVRCNFEHFRCRWPPDQEIIEILAKNDRLDGPEHAFLGVARVENEQISTAFIARLDRGTYSRFEEAMQIWAGYLVPPHAFDYCWRYLTATNRQYREREDEYVFGKTVDERMANLKRTLIDAIPLRERNSPGWPSSRAWREALIRLFRPIASLLSLERVYRWDARRSDEAWARQDEVIEIVLEHPQLVPVVIQGVLDYGDANWDVLDPIVLGLQQDVTVAVLQEYLHGKHSHNSHYHARLLLAHVRGDMPKVVPHGLGNPSGILSAVENLIAVSRTRLPHDQSQIWLGDVAIESLWLGAMEAANKEFAVQFDSQFGQDEHEHVAILADALARHLNATNATVSVWIDHKRAVPAFLNVCVRRFPKTARSPLPQEGGHAGLQADLAILMTCEIPDMAIADRVTLLQAKKVGKNRRGQTWQDMVKVSRQQLARLIAASGDAHYLFILHSQLGRSPLILPARMVSDVLRAQGTPAIPLAIILRASKVLPAFFLYDIIGLWTGDTSRKLVETVKQGADQGQGPRVLIEVTLKPRQE